MWTRYGISAVTEGKQQKTCKIHLYLKNNVIKFIKWSISDHFQLIILFGNKIKPLNKSQPVQFVCVVQRLFPRRFQVVETVRVFVTDANDEPPEFQNLPFIIDIPEVQYTESIPPYNKSFFYRASRATGK